MPNLAEIVLQRTRDKYDQRVDLKNGPMTVSISLVTNFGRASFLLINGTRPVQFGTKASEGGLQ